MSAADPPPRPPLGLWVCVLVGTALRLARWERAAVLFNDGPVFLALAERSAAGHPEVLLQHPFHPLYPIAIAALSKLLAPLGVGLETTAALISILSGGAAIVALHALVRRAFGPREALVAAWLLAFHAGVVETADVQSESLYLALFLGACAALWRLLERWRTADALATGVLSGLAYLTRPEGLGVALVGGGLLGLHALARHVPLRRALALGGALATATAFCVLPYAGLLSAETGKPMLTRKKSVGWLMGRAGADGSGGLATGQAGMEAPKVWDRPPREVMFGIAPPRGPGAEGAKPAESGNEAEGAQGAAAARVPAREGAPASAPPAPGEPDPFDSLVPPPWTARSWGSALFDVVHNATGASLRPEIAALVLAGMIALRGRPGRRAGFFAAIVGAYGVLLFALATNVGYVSARHTMAPMVLLLGYGGAGVLALGDWLGARGAGDAGTRRRRARAVQIALVAGVALVCFGKTLRKPEGIETLAERRAAEWLRGEAPGSVVAARKRRVAYYAGAPFVQLRPKTALGFEGYFRSHAVGYVIVAARNLPEYVGLADLAPDRLRELRRFDVAGETAIVFAYHPEPLPGEAP